MLNKWNTEWVTLKSEYCNWDSNGYKINSSRGNYGILLEDFYILIPDLVQKSNFNMIFKNDYSQLSFNDLKEILSRLNPNKKMCDLLNKELLIGDLVIYIDSYYYKYGIVVSDKSIFSETGQVKNVNYVYKIKELTENEEEIKNTLKNYYSKILANSIKVQETNIGGIYKLGQSYYLNLGYMDLSCVQLAPSNYKINFSMNKKKPLWIKFEAPNYKRNFLSEEIGLEDNQLFNHIITYLSKYPQEKIHKYVIDNELYSTYYTIEGLSNLLYLKNTDKLKFQRKITLPDNIKFKIYEFEFILSKV